MSLEQLNLKPKKVTTVSTLKFGTLNAEEASFGADAEHACCLSSVGLILKAGGKNWLNPTK